MKKVLAIMIHNAYNRIKQRPKNMYIYINIYIYITIAKRLRKWTL